MYVRIINLSQTHSFFLFGARGTGKTSLLKELFAENSHYIDLLNLDSESRYQLDPESLTRELTELKGKTKFVIIDEIQKVPKLLDVVHRQIQLRTFIFILTGSSARKLKQGAANLLAGRAFVFNLYPLTATELGDNFHLERALTFGTLPEAVNLPNDRERGLFLKAYANTYLKEEVWGEQLVRKIEPFRKFLPVAAQCHGEPLNYTRIAEDIGVDDVTVKNYFSILEDTLIGFTLPAFSMSVRRQLKTTPKFYFFDNGVKRAVEGVMGLPVSPGSSEYGVLFEQLVIVEIMRRLAYRDLDLSYSYLATRGGAEVDLVISRGKKVIALVEIKSGKEISKRHLKHLQLLAPDFPGAAFFCLYGGTASETFSTGTETSAEIRLLPWLAGVEALMALVK